MAGHAARGKRLIWGGRARVRSALYMSTLSAVRYNPILRAFWTRLREQGKPPRALPHWCELKRKQALRQDVTESGPPTTRGWAAGSDADNATAPPSGTRSPSKSTPDMVSSRTFEGRLRLLEYVPTVLAGPPGATRADDSARS
jgi:hypothetical protein